MEQLIKACAREVVITRPYVSDDPLKVCKPMSRYASSYPSSVPQGLFPLTTKSPPQGFITEVAKEMCLPPEKPEIRTVDAAKDAAGRPLPPYLSTVNNLGLNNTPGMPNLAVSIHL